MPVNLPNNPNAETIQGPGPTGQEGYPVATVPATGADPTVVQLQLIDTLLKVRSAKGATNTDGSQIIPVAILLFDGTNFQEARTNLGDNSGRGATLPIYLLQYNGSQLDMVRTPTTWKTVFATASGDTALWTPATGKKFRLMRVYVNIPDATTSTPAGLVTITLRDGTSPLPLVFDEHLQPNAPPQDVQDYKDTGMLDLGNGILSAAANNVLNVNLSQAITAGGVRVIVGGTEE